MNGSKKELIDTINRSMAALQCEADRCRCIVTAILEQNIDEQLFSEFPAVLTPPAARTETLREAIKEAIEVLDQSRKAFKSKRLEALRKKLTQVLIDAQ